MGRAQTLPQKRQLYAVKDLALTAVICLLASLSAAQATGGDAPQAPLAQELHKYPELLPEFGQLLQKIQRDVQFPPARSQSSLLPLLPQSTIFYVAFPNFGDAFHQALTIFQKDLQQSPALRAWWQHGELATDGPKVEDSLEKLYQLSQYLGDEIVISGATEGRKEPKLLILAEVRKPGLKDFLQQLSKNPGGKSTQALRVLSVQDLATLKDTGPAQQPVILVRPDFVLGALDVATLRSFNPRMERNAREFVSTEFGQRVARAYEGGTVAVGAANLQKILSEIPRSADQNETVFQRAGFSDVKYAVWEHKNVARHKYLTNLRISPPL